MPKPRSLCWDHFSRIDKLNAQCNTCGCVLKTTGGSTTTLHNHVKVAHPEALTEAQDCDELRQTPDQSKVQKELKPIIVTIDDEGSSGHQGTEVGSIGIERSLKRSTAWNYFTRIDKLNAQCATCGFVLKTPSGSTTTLRNHMKVLHPQVLADAGDFELLAAATPTRTKQMVEVDIKHILDDSSNSNFEEEEQSYGQEMGVDGHSHNNTVWIYFTRIDKDKSECNNCGMIIKTTKSFTYALQHHMKVMHPDVLGCKSQLEEPNEFVGQDDNYKHQNIDRYAQRSTAWNYFTRIDKEKSQCISCGVIIKTTRGSTSALRNHMKMTHPEVLVEAQDFKLLGCSPHRSENQSEADIQIVDDELEGEPSGQDQNNISDFKDDEGDYGDDSASKSASVLEENFERESCGNSDIEIEDATFDDEDQLSAEVTIDEDNTEYFRYNKKRSSCWNYFYKIDSLNAQCNSCGYVIKTPRGSTSALRNHVRVAHPDVLANAGDYELLGDPLAKTSSQPEAKKNTMKNESPNIEDTPMDDQEMPKPITEKPNVWKRSSCWNYFTKIDSLNAQCNTCGTILRTPRASTSGIRNHLKFMHPDVLANAQDYELLGVSTSGSEPQGEVPPKRKESSTISEGSLAVKEFTQVNPGFENMYMRSSSWIYFNKIDKNNAQCKTCGSNLKTPCGATSGMRGHMKCMHPDVLADALDFELLDKPKKSATNSRPNSDEVNSDDEVYSSQKKKRKPDLASDVKILETTNCYEDNWDTNIALRIKRSRSDTSVSPRSSNNQPQLTPDANIMQSYRNYYPEKQNYDEMRSDNSSIQNADPQNRFQLKLMNDLMKFFFDSDVPLFSSDELDFKNMIKCLEPKLDQRSMVAFTKQRSGALYDRAKEGIASNFQNELEHLKGACFTAVLWADTKDAPVQELTIHYISKDFKLKKHLAGWTPYFGNETSGLIKANLDGLIAFLDLKPNLCRWSVNNYHNKIVIDAANSEQINSELICCNQKINTIVRSAIEKTSSFKSALEKCSQLVRQLNTDSSLLKIVSEKCHEIGINYKSLNLSDKYSWRSQLQQIVDVTTMRSALEALAECTDEIQHITKEEFSTLEGGKSILQVFDRMSQVLSSAEGPTLNHVIVQLYNTTQSLRAANHKQQELATNLLKETEKHFTNCGTDIAEYSVAHLLDPTFKGVILRKLNKLEVTETLLLQFEPKSAPEYSYQSDQELNYSELVLQEYIADGTLQSKSGLREELDWYLRSAPCDKSKPILDWWRDKESCFPILSKLARKYLGVPATVTEMSSASP